MTQLDTKYWLKSTKLIIKIIEGALFNKSKEATSDQQEREIKAKKRSINYGKLREMLYKYSCQHDECYSQLLNVLFLFGFRNDNNDNKLTWNKNFDQSFHPQMAILYCQLKNMINENWKIESVNYGDKEFNHELIESPMSFIIDRFCGIVTNDEICKDISCLIYKYAFKEYKVKKCMDNSPAVFIRNLQLLQDPKKFNSVIMCIGDERYLFINIQSFKRPKGYISDTLKPVSGWIGHPYPYPY